MKIDSPVFILGSGPSMTSEDAERVKGFFTIAVNSTWKLARWCDVLFAGDLRWWTSYGKEVDIPAMRVSNSKSAGRKFNASPMKRSEAATPGHNSGQLAILWAIQKGAKDIYLLGFDCSVINGIHHHGPHDKTPNPNATRCDTWQKQFARISKHHPDVSIINCSRYTELEAFPCKSLEVVLEGFSESSLHSPRAAAGF